MSTRAARVDMEADRINKSMMMESDSGMTLVRSSGINASTLGLPLSRNAAGEACGLRKTRVVEPRK